VPRIQISKQRRRKIFLQYKQTKEIRVSLQVLPFRNKMAPFVLSFSFSRIHNFCDEEILHAPLGASTCSFVYIIHMYILKGFGQELVCPFKERGTSGSWIVEWERIVWHLRNRHAWRVFKSRRRFASILSTVLSQCVTTNPILNSGTGYNKANLILLISASYSLKIIRYKYNSSDTYIWNFNLIQFIPRFHSFTFSILIHGAYGIS